MQTSVTGQAEEWTGTYSDTCLRVLCALGPWTGVTAPVMLRFLFIDRNRPHLDGKHFVIHFDEQEDQCSGLMLENSRIPAERR